MTKPRMAAAALLAAFAWMPHAVAQSANYRASYWHMGEWSWGHMMFGGGLMMLLFWGAVIALIVAAVFWFRRSADRTPAPTKPSAREFLEERFARGEIDEAEFQRRLKVLDAEDRNRRA